MKTENLGAGKLAGLSLAALGVVYGDIGTSPLYALRETFHALHGLTITRETILGILSLIFWSLILVISVKYLVFVLRADNRGEGGILALTALVTPISRPDPKGKRVWVMMGLFGTALLYGDGMITPAISVLSAIEGLKIATPVFEPFIVPITIMILIALFAIQKRGTAQVGRIFGPITLIWFATLSVLGGWQILQEPTVIEAVNPIHAYRFFAQDGWSAFLAMGSVFLVVTGGEALYSDLGHFGKSPIRWAWFTVVLPSLLLNYFGQGALLLRNPAAIENPFYLMAPDWALYPLTVIATLATVIASQALITGAFSITMQAVQLGYLPRILIEHKSATHYGQIYVRSINWVLMVACISLVLGFGSSSNLAAAYGLAVTTTMVITTILLFHATRELWKWPLPLAFGVCSFFLAIDLAYWLANLPKIPHGGWFPLVIGGIIFTVMVTWKKGRMLLAENLGARVEPTQTFVNRLRSADTVRVPGTAVYMYSNPMGTPPALHNSFRHFGVLHEKVVLLAVTTCEIPHVPLSDRVRTSSFGEGFYGVELNYGFMEDPNIPNALHGLSIGEFEFKPGEATYFLGREKVIATDKPGMEIWREKLFSFMSHNATSATAYFGLPAERVVEIGAQIEM